ncbi:MAG: AAA family ATPase, partial [Planctomycetaceae bacterium]
MKMPSPTGIDRPFPNVPASDRYLAIGSIEEARCRICKMIDRNEGLGVIIGPPGTGKTLLCQRLAAQYRTTHTVVSLGDIRVSSRTGLIQQVLLQLRLPQQGLDEQAMQLALLECLAKGNDGARSLLLLIDEAQMLSLELLDEIRMLT